MRTNSQIHIAHSTASTVSEKSIRRAIIAIRLSRLRADLSVELRGTPTLRHSLRYGARLKVDQTTSEMAVQSIDSKCCAVVVSISGVASTCSSIFVSLKGHGEIINDAAVTYQGPSLTRVVERLR